MIASLCSKFFISAISVAKTHPRTTVTTVFRLTLKAGISSYILWEIICIWCKTATEFLCGLNIVGTSKGNCNFARHWMLCVDCWLTISTMMPKEEDTEALQLPIIDNDFLVALPKRTDGSSPQPCSAARSNGHDGPPRPTDDLTQSRNRRTSDNHANKKNGTLSRPSQSTSSKSLSSVSIGTRKSTSSSGSEIRSQNEYLEKCVSDIFERHRQPSSLSVRTSGSGSSRATTEDGRGSSELENEVDNVSATLDESLRWDNPCENPADEKERIRLYKVNRRKRYLMDIVKQRRDKEGVLKFAVELASMDPGS